MRGRIIYSKFGSHRYFINDTEVTQEEFDERFPAKPIGMTGQAQTPSCWPMKSDALAVHPDQIEEAMANDRKHGLATRYDEEDGRLILTDRGMRRDYMRLQRCHDKHAGYGD